MATIDPILSALLASDPTLGQAPVDPYAATANEFGFDPTIGQVPLDPYAQPAQPPTARPTSEKTKVATGREAVDMGTFDTFQTGKPASRYDKKLADIGRAVGADFEAESAERKALGEREKALATRSSEIQAAQATDRASAMTKYAAKEGEIAAQMQTFHDAAWQRVQQAGVDYQSQLATLRAARIDPKAYYRDMNEGQRADNSLKHFLAMSMIGTGKPGFQEMGQAMLEEMDADVKRNIDAQVENLRNDQVVAEGFKAAWQLAGQTAVNEEQAKERVKGMILQSYKDTLAAEIATKYDSDLARAAGEQAAMEIDKKILETDVKQKEIARKFWLDQAELVTRKYIADQQASIQREQNQIERAQLDLQKGKGPGAIDPELLVADPETGERRYLANTKESKKDLDTIALAAQNFQDAMNRLDAAVRDSGGRALGGARDLMALRNSKDQKIAALANRVLYSYAKIVDPTARTVTDNDFTNASRSIPIMGIFSRASGEEARQAIKQMTVDETRTAYRIYSTDINPESLPPGVPRFGAQVPVQQGAGAEANAKPPVTSDLEKTIGALKSPAARDVTSSPEEEADRSWSTFLREDAPKAMRRRWTDAREGREQLAKQTGRPLVLGDVDTPGWVVPMNDIAIKASDKKLPEEERKKARTELFRIMRLEDQRYKKDGEDVSDEDLDRAYYAKHLLGFDTSKE